jgi:hypothetical protein
MEGNTAYWAPMSTSLAAFPVIGAELLYTATFFIGRRSFLMRVSL